jgi:hypothetical protein
MRVEADMRIWVAKKLQHTLAEDEENEEGEGGAALRSNLEVERGDMIEFWSADPDIVLSPVTAIIVDVKSREEGSEDMLHLHFMDPPLGEVRSAIYALQSRNETRAT